MVLIEIIRIKGINLLITSQFALIPQAPIQGFMQRPSRHWRSPRQSILSRHSPRLQWDKGFPLKPGRQEQIGLPTDDSWHIAFTPQGLLLQPLYETLSENLNSN